MEWGLEVALRINSALPFQEAGAGEREVKVQRLSLFYSLKAGSPLMDFKMPTKMLLEKTRMLFIQAQWVTLS